MLLQACWPAGLDLGFGCADPTAYAALARVAALGKEVAEYRDRERHFREMYVCARDERAGNRGEIDSLKGELESARQQIAQYEQRLTYYENCNNPSSTMSLFNKKRKQFREVIKAKERAGTGGEAVSWDAGEESANKRKRPGPPKGHAGTSHSNKPEATVKVPFESCAECASSRVEQLRACTKLVSDLGADRIVHTVAFIVGEGVCLDCGAKSKARVGVLEGTSFGPRLLGIVDEYFHAGCTDQSISVLLERVHNFKTSPNAVLNGREALARSIIRHQKGQIMDELDRYPYVIMDETAFPRDGKKGEVWLAMVPTALWVSFEHTRSATVLYEKFGMLRGKVGVVDGYGAYKKFFRWIQRDWVHVVRHGEEACIRLADAAKAAAERDRAAAEAAFHRALEGYSDLHALRKTARATALAPFTIHDLTLAARGLSLAFADHKFSTELYNAAPDLFTFVWNKGVPDNTARVEVAVRDAVIRQRVVRNQMINYRGMERFSALVSFNHTCQLNGVWPCLGVRELCLNPPWNMFSGVPDRGPDWSLFDRWGLFARWPPPSQVKATHAA